MVVYFRFYSPTYLGVGNDDTRLYFNKKRVPTFISRDSSFINDLIK